MAGAGRKVPVVPAARQIGHSASPPQKLSLHEDLRAIEWVEISNGICSGAPDDGLSPDAREQPGAQYSSSEASWVKVRQWSSGKAEARCPHSFPAPDWGLRSHEIQKGTKQPIEKLFIQRAGNGSSISYSLSFSSLFSPEKAQLRFPSLPLIPFMRKLWQ